MTNETEKQFFDTFGIKAKYESHSCDGWGRTVEVKYFTDKKEADKFGIVVSEPKYPEITDHILLKLICYLSRYYLDLIPEYACFKTIDQLKEHVLKCALKFKIANTVPILYSQDLQELFKEV